MINDTSMQASGVQGAGLDSTLAQLESAGAVSEGSSSAKEIPKEGTSCAANCFGDVGSGLACFAKKDNGGELVC